MWGGAILKTEWEGRGLCTSNKGCGNGPGSTGVRLLPLFPSAPSASQRECPCEGAGDREEGKGGCRVKGPTPSCWLPTNQEESCAVLEATEGEQRRRWSRRRDKQGKKEGGWTARRIPRVNYPREGGTVTNTLHLICKAAAKVHLSTASERPAIAPRQLMSLFNDMCFSVWQWLASCGLGQLAKRVCSHRDSFHMEIPASDSPAVLVIGPKVQT